MENTAFGSTPGNSSYNMNRLGEPLSPTRPSHSRRAAMACTHCRKNKRKCEPGSGFTCKRCLKKQLDCIFIPCKQERSPSLPPSLPPSPSMEPPPDNIPMSFDLSANLTAPFDSVPYNPSPYYPTNGMVTGSGVSNDQFYYDPSLQESHANYTLVNTEPYPYYPDSAIPQFYIQTEESPDDPNRQPEYPFLSQYF